VPANLLPCHRLACESASSLTCSRNLHQFNQSEALHHATPKEIIDALRPALLGYMMQAIKPSSFILDLPKGTSNHLPFDHSTFKIDRGLIKRAQTFKHSENPSEFSRTTLKMQIFYGSAHSQVSRSLRPF